MKKYILAFLMVSSCAVSAERVVYETDWISSESTSSTLNEMNGNRLFPCRIEGKLEEIKIRYKSSYCPLGKDMDYFYSRWGMSDYWYETYTKKYIAMGYKEYFHTSFTDLGGSSIHQATWILDYGSTSKESSGFIDRLWAFFKRIKARVGN